jgi:hypothetical protein
LIMRGLRERLLWVEGGRPVVAPTWGCAVELRITITLLLTIPQSLPATAPFTQGSLYNACITMESKKNTPLEKTQGELISYSHKD